MRIGYGPIHGGQIGENASSQAITMLDDDAESSPDGCGPLMP
jgi:hypothetical protein